MRFRIRNRRWVSLSMLLIDRIQGTIECYTTIYSHDALQTAPLPNARHFTLSQTPKTHIVATNSSTVEGCQVLL